MPLINQKGFENLNRVVTTFAVDGSPVPNYDNMRIGSYVHRKPCYILAPEGSIITATFTIENPFTFVLNAANPSVLEIYGQLLLASGRSINLEPGSKPPPEPPKPPVAQGLPQNYQRYTHILNTAKGLKLVNASLKIPDYRAYKAGEASIWRNAMPTLIRGIKNLTGRDV